MRSLRFCFPTLSTHHYLPNYTVFISALLPTNPSFSCFTVYRNYPLGAQPTLFNCDSRRISSILTSEPLRLFPNRPCSYSNVSHRVQFLHFLFSYHQRFAFFFFFLIRGICWFSHSEEKEKHILYSVFLRFWKTESGGFEGRQLGSGWISEIHLCTNAYFLREGNFLQLCSPAHSYSPSLVTHQCSWECIVLWLTPKKRERTVLPLRGLC